MPERPLKIVITGGGTGGHVQPGLATLQVLQQRCAIEPTWIGSASGFERETAIAQGIPYRAIATGKLRRYLSLHTITDAARIPIGVLQAVAILRSLRPDLVFATGGFVSVPAIVAARLLRTPSLSHEQTATAGLATRINARFCNVVALSYAASGAALAGSRARTVVTGNPVRAELLSGCRERAFAHFDLDPRLPLIYITGGASGAQALNEAVRECLPDILEHAQVVHQCGPTANNGDYPKLVALRESLPTGPRSRYVVCERVGPELADLYAAASLAVSRAGAGTLAEIATLGVPAILVPLPGAGGDEQTRNARVLADVGAAVLLPQAELTPARLTTEIRGILDESGRAAEMARRAREHSHAGAAERLADELLQLAGRATTKEPATK